MTAALLDSVLVVETPEGVTLSLRLAGLIPRALAYLIDLLIRGVILLGLARVFLTLGAFGQGLFLIALFLIEWLYPVLFEVYGGGATPGKRLLGLAVLESSGLPVGWQAALVRNLLRFADFLPFCFGFGVLSMLFSPQFQRLGDLAAGTVVVWRKPVRAAGALPDVTPVEPPVRLTLGEQQHLVDFAERFDRLSPERQLELADLAAPLSGQAGRPGMARLLGMAAFMAGKR